jgi:hypothetical protein
MVRDAAQHRADEKPSNILVFWYIFGFVCGLFGGITATLILDLIF